MDFKDIPKEVQVIAAENLSNALYEARKLTSKENGLENKLAHEIQQAFLKLYSLSECARIRNGNDLTKK